MVDVSAVQTAATTAGAIGAVVFTVYAALAVGRWVQREIGIGGLGHLDYGNGGYEEGENGGWVSNGECHEIMGEYTPTTDYEGNWLAAEDRNDYDPDGDEEYLDSIRSAASQEEIDRIEREYEEKRLEREREIAGF